jgi:hypothetical protein
MAQSLVQHPAAMAARQRLLVEKLGVIAGFLFGLFLSVGLALGPLSMLGAPDWLELLAIAVTVLSSARLGLAVALALSRKAQP